MPLVRGYGYVLLLCLWVMLGGGCKTTTLDSAVNTANSTHAIAKDAETVEDLVCTFAYRQSKTLAEIADVDPYCLRLRTALADYETAWRSLSAAIVAVRLGVPNADALLADREETVRLTSAALARAIEGRP